MRIEINKDNTILLFIDNNELAKRGFLTENYSEHVELINEIVDDVLLFAASSTDYFPIDGSFKTEASYVPSEGAYITITMLNDADEPTGTKNVQNPSNTDPDPVFLFASVDDLIDCSMKFPAAMRGFGRVYHYNNKYYLLIDFSDLDESLDRSLLEAIVTEYANKAEITKEVMEEYGKIIWDSAAIRQISEIFSK